MTDEWLMAPGWMERAEMKLERCNRMTEPYGLVLTQSQMERLTARRREVLRAVGRVEFGEGVLPRLILAFRDSPYLEQHDYEEQLDGLQELFYRLKNECGEGLTDDELIGAMKRLYDGPAGGSLEFLAGVPADDLRRIGRTGSLKGTEWEEEPLDENW